MDRADRGAADALSAAIVADLRVAGRRSVDNAGERVCGNPRRAVVNHWPNHTAIAVLVDAALEAGQRRGSARNAA